MSTARKITIGLGVAGGALLAAWLLTGNRKKKTKEIIVKGASNLRNTLKKDQDTVVEESEVHYL